MGAKRLGGKRLGGETTRGEMVWGRNDPDSLEQDLMIQKKNSFQIVGFLC